jgi:hypothetical protein
MQRSTIYAQLAMEKTLAAEALKAEFLRLCNAKSAARRKLSDALWSGYMALEIEASHCFKHAQESGHLLLCHPGYLAAKANAQATA